MKYFLDTEFMERPGSIDLISIGIVREDGCTFYAESTTFDERKANDFVKEQVLPKLRFWGNMESPLPYYSKKSGQSYVEVFGPTVWIRECLEAFFKEDKNPELWAYYADYDWVVFCWIWGTMMDLPKKFPRFCRDLVQEMKRLGVERLPKPDNCHNALDDAFWNKDMYSLIQKEEALIDASA